MIQQQAAMSNSNAIQSLLKTHMTIKASHKMNNV